MLNRILNKWGITDSPYCDLRNKMEIDDVRHSLVVYDWTCDKIEMILEQMCTKSYFGSLDWKALVQKIILGNKREIVI